MKSSEGEASAHHASEYEALAMRRYPGLLEVHERYTAVSGHESFSHLPHFALTETRALGREEVVTLAAQWLRERGYAKSALALLEEAQLGGPDPGALAGNDLLRKVLQTSAPGDEQVFADHSFGMEALLEDEVESDEEVTLGVELGGIVRGAEVGPNDNSESIFGWEENSSLLDDGIEAMTVRQVCQAVAEGRGEPKLRTLVALTHPQWTSAGELLRTLVELYEKAGNDEERTRGTVQAVCWFVGAGNGPRELVGGIVQRFAARAFELGRSKHAAELRAALGRLVREPVELRTAQWVDPNVPKNIFSPLLQLSDVPVVEVARQMTLVDAALLGRVTAHELMQGEQSVSSTGALAALLRRFRAIEQWASVSVSRERGKEAVARVRSYFVALAHQLLELDSFHASAAILGGLLHDSARDGENNLLSSDAQHQMVRLQRVFHPSGLFYAYRALNDQRRGIAPTVPFLLPHLQRVQLLLHASSNWSPVDSAAVNLPKFARLADVLEEVVQSVRARFPFLVVAQIQAFVSTSTIERQSQ